MTAKELILKLQQLKTDTKIVIREYAESTDADALDAIDLFGENENAGEK